MQLTAIPNSDEKPMEFPCQIAFKSIGYKACLSCLGNDPLIPFDEKRGIIPNQNGRVTLPTKQPSTQGNGIMYVSGWIKRGPTGTIVTTWQDAQDTVHTIVEDFLSQHNNESIAIKEAQSAPINLLEQLLNERNVKFINWKMWQYIDKIERERGKELGKSRVKFASVSEILEALNHCQQQEFD